MDTHFYERKRVLVTGHTGFKGAWLTMILNTLGAEVVGFSDDVLPGDSLYTILRPQTYQAVRGDICDLELLKETIHKFQIQYIFHLAAQTIVKTGSQLPYETFRVNTMGSAALLEAVRQCPCVEGLLFVTTDKVYQNGTDQKSFAEDHPLWATSPYAASKCCAELLVQTYHKTYWENCRPLGVAVARAGNVIGGGDFAPYRIIPDCVRAWSKNEPVLLRNPGAVRPYQHVLDALFAYVEILQWVCSADTKFHTYNVGPDRAEICTTKDLVELFYRSLNVTSAMYLPSLDASFAEDMYLMLNSDKLFTDLNYKPLWNLQQAVDKTAEWYRIWMRSGDVRQCCMAQIQAHLEKGVCHGT